MALLVYTAIVLCTMLGVEYCLLESAYIAHVGWIQLLVLLILSSLAISLALNRALHSRLKDVTMAERIAYNADIWLSSDPSAKPMALLYATFVLILVGGVLLSLVQPQSITAAWWSAWTWVADPGTHVDVGAGGERVVAFLITLGGMLVFALLIGIVSDEISGKVDELKKGKTRVLEVDHTLVVGWSDKIVPLLREICLANESEGGTTIVILAEQDKEEMETTIEDAGFDRHGCTILCRSGSGLNSAALNKVSCTMTKSVVLLASREIGADDSDAMQVRIVLLLSQLLKEANLGTHEGPHLVVEMQDVDNKQIVEIAGRGRVEIVVAHDVIGRLMIASTRQPMLSHVLGQLVSFDGPEFYIKHWPALVGRSFEEVLYAFEDAVPVGIEVERHGQRKVILNPPSAYIIGATDAIVVVAEDDDAYKPSRKPFRPEPQPHIQAAPLEQSRERILFLNWRRDMDDMVAELDAAVGPQSVLFLMSSKSNEEQQEALRENGLDPEALQNLRIHHRQGNTVTRRALESLKLEEFSTILILADESEEASSFKKASDSRSLATLLLVREIQQQRRRAKHRTHEKTTVLSEILDPQTQQLAQSIDGSDYIMSNELVSAILAQVSETRALNAIFSELLSSVGNEFYLRPITRYMQADQMLSFWDLQARASAYDEILLGYSRGSTVIINPEDKRGKMQWLEGDHALVLAAD